MKAPIAYIDIRTSAHATEDLEKVKKAVYNLFPEDCIDELTFKKTVTKGHYGNPITLFEARIKDKRLIGAFVGKISTNVSKLDRETIIRGSNLFVERSNLYLRLDKQAAFEGQFKLQKADPIHIRIHFTKRDEKRIMEICQELGLTL